MRIVVQNSFCKVEGDIPPLVDQLLRQVLTYQNDIAAEVKNCFYQMNIAKRYGNMQKYYASKKRIDQLKATEFVCLYQNGSFPTGLLNIIQECLREFKADFEVSDLRESPGSSAILRWNNTPWEPRYYQKEMIALGLKHGRGVFEAAVGSGKSLVMAYLIKEIAAKSLIVVPSRGLSGQIYNDFSSWFGAGNVELLDANKIRKLKRPKAISIVTVQSLGSLHKSGEFKAFAEQIDALFVDEVHHSGAATYTKLLNDLDHVYYRFGFTGTFLRNDNKTLDMWSFLSNVLFTYPAHQAISEGFLTPMETWVHTLSGKAIKKYQKEYDHHYCGNPELLDKINHIISQSDGGQVLILVSKKDKGGKIIHEYLNTLGIHNAYISGDNSKDEINQTIEYFNEKQIQVLIGSSVIGEGIDVRSADHLIMCQGGKSEITMVQAAGRLVRLHPGKLKAYLHDFRFEGTRYMQKHLDDDRLDAYVRNFQCEIFNK